VTIIRDTNLKRIPGSVKPDSKKRIVLPKIGTNEDILYYIYVNEAGQILLDPQIPVPASEAWIYENPEVTGAIKKGIAEAKRGKISKIDIDSL
jgi:hypothetical protein